MQDVQPVADVKQACRNIVKTLQQERSLYLNFGPYWYAVKRILKKNEYGPDQLYMLGNFMDAEALKHLPHATDEYMLAHALAYFEYNQTMNVGSPDSYFPDTNEPYHLADPDANQE